MHGVRQCPRGLHGLVSSTCGRVLVTGDLNHLIADDRDLPRRSSISSYRCNPYELSGSEQALLQSQLYLEIHISLCNAHTVALLRFTCTFSHGGGGSQRSLNRCMVHHVILGMGLMDKLSPSSVRFFFVVCSSIDDILSSAPRSLVAVPVRSSKQVESLFTGSRRGVPSA